VFGSDFNVEMPDAAMARLRSLGLTACELERDRAGLRTLGLLAQAVPPAQPHARSM
jgi:hypothetical protein